jgi:hypothetical protein
LHARLGFVGFRDDKNEVAIQRLCGWHRNFDALRVRSAREADKGENSGKEFHRIRPNSVDWQKSIVLRRGRAASLEISAIWVSSADLHESVLPDAPNLL